MDWFKVTPAIAGILLGAALAWASTFYFQWRGDRSEKKRFLTVLFGELLNIRQHYFLVSEELPNELSTRADLLALQMSRYGELAFSGRDLSHLSFLSDKEIRDLMQLALVVRNTDYAIDLALSLNSEKGGNEFDVLRIRTRMIYAKEVTEQLIEAISNRNRRLKSLIPGAIQFS